jgi:putative transposase
MALQVEVADVAAGEADNRPWVGIDIGVFSFAALSNGTRIDNPRIGKQAAGKLKRRQRALARCRRGSNRRKAVKAKLARAARKVADTRKTFLHQQSAHLAQAFGLIAVEDLTVKAMTATAKGTADAPGTMVRQKAGLNRALLDVAPARFVAMLAYKAERAGGRLVKVDPRWTSQDCSGCAARVAKDWSQRRHRCGCGTVLDRDVNAARNILAKAVVGLEGAKQALACSP